MSIETELKLRLSPEHLARLRRHALFKTQQITPPVTRRLHNIYYDTPTLDLHRGEMALRLRRSGGIWLQTLKGGGQVMAGMHQRCEWEVPVPSGELDFSGLDTSVWDEHLPPALRDKLQPVFVTDFYRSSRLLEWQGAEIEVCMDHGEVKTSQYSMPICEVELELKSGNSGQLFDLALALLEIVPFELETVSKAEQGFRLLSGYIEQPVKGGLVRLGENAPLTDVLQTLVWTCLLHLQGNLQGVMNSTDNEYLHQMRVALRRLRVVLRMAEKIRADEQLAALRQELTALAAALGRVRDWDVFIAGIAAPLCAVRGGDAGLQVLLNSSEQRRADCYATLRDTVQARDLQRLILRLAIWMNGSYWPQAGQGAPRTRDFATRHLHRLAKRYRQAGLYLNTLDAPRLHALRILAKKLRYSAEFFADLYDRKKAGPYLSALGEVQEVLGQINDVAAAHRLLDELAANPDLPVQQEVIALTRNEVDKNLSKLISKLHKTAELFDKQYAFW